MKTVAFHTLGCKVNQYDSQAMLELFEAAGYRAVSFDAAADVYVINTCTVTGTGDKKSLQAARRAKRLHPGAEIVLCGCLAQRDGEKLLREAEIRLIIGTSRRAQVVELLEQAIREERSICAVEDVRRAAFEPLYISRQEGRTRATLKIQEGCDRFCTYCIIPYVRGGIRSRAVCEIALETERLAQAGYREIVLTGIHLTSYGRDLKDGTTLLDAIRAVHAVEGVERIRLGSLEPVIADEAFAEALGQLPKVCPQFHLALQSGCDSVLKRMHRRYDTEAFRKSAAALRKVFPNAAMTTDVLCGFPGETEEEHAATMAFCEEIAFSRMHVFPYSERQGTPAATMPGSVPKRIREERARELIALGARMADRYRDAQVGQKRQVLFETYENGRSAGYTMEYMRCTAPGDLRGQALEVLIDGTEGEDLTAIIPE